MRTPACPRSEAKGPMNVVSGIAHRARKYRPSSLTERRIFVPSEERASCEHLPPRHMGVGAGRVSFMRPSSIPAHECWGRASIPMRPHLPVPSGTDGISAEGPCRGKRSGVGFSHPEARVSGPLKRIGRASLFVPPSFLKRIRSPTPLGTELASCG